MVSRSYQVPAATRISRLPSDESAASIADWIVGCVPPGPTVKKGRGSA
jgi:hypothetical protein